MSGECHEAENQKGLVICFIEKIAETYKDATKIMLIMDNFNNHKPVSLYEIFQPEKAKALRNRFQVDYTPNHGSWLNMAEEEPNVLTPPMFVQKNCIYRGSTKRGRSVAKITQLETCFEKFGS